MFLDQLELQHCVHEREKERGGGTERGDKSDGGRDRERGWREGERDHTDYQTPTQFQPFL